MARRALPPGFWRSPNGALRVLIRVKGWPTAVKTFRLAADTPDDRRRQMAAAQAWALDTRERMYSGNYVCSRAAQAMTLADALNDFAQKALTTKLRNRQKDEARIREILGDPIAARSVASLTRQDLAAYRDFLIERAWSRKIARAVAALRGQFDAAALDRLEKLRLMSRLRSQMAQEKPDEAALTAQRLTELERDIEMRPPARTTISNKIQLIRRALRHVGQSVAGVPELRGVTMPGSRPGRTRRPSADELERIYAHGANFNSLLPLIVRFAIATALRLERVLECRTSNIRAIGAGKFAIMFERTAERTKRTGVIPITPEIETIVRDALALSGHDMAIEDAARVDVKLFPVGTNSFSHSWRGLLKRLEIRDLRFHDLRHEATSRLFERGLTAAEVMSITGHSTNDMVDRYAHYSSLLVLQRL